MTTYSILPCLPYPRAVVAGLMLLAAVGCESGSLFQNPVAAIIDSIAPPSPGEAARDMFNPFDADKRRNGIALLSSAPFGGDDVYVQTYRTLITDDDSTVRAACVRALGLHGTVKDVKDILLRLEDPVSHVRLEAACALQKIHSPDAVRPLVAHMEAPQPGGTSGEESADVRAACAYALGQYAEPLVFDALVGALNDTDFTVVHAARQSLYTLCGYDFGNDAALWQIWEKKNTGKIFEKQQQYTWKPFEKRPTLFERAQFWKDPKHVEPQTPIGLDAAKEEEGKGESKS